MRCRGSAAADVEVARVIKDRSTAPQRAPKEASFHGGIYIDPFHSSLEGEGGRREIAAVNGSDVRKWYVFKDYSQNSIDIYHIL